MTEEELLELYTRNVPGKTFAQRAKALRDAGIDLFAEPQQFIEEDFVGTPEPELVNPVGQAYGRSEGWQNVFGKIESGMDPDSAVEAAISEGIIPKPKYGDERNNPYEIARQYALKEAENEAAWNEWSKSNQVEAAKFGAKQNRLRSQFEAEQPLTAQDLMGVSQLELAGNPSIEDLSAYRTQTRMDELNRLAASRRRRKGEPVVTPMGANLGSFKEVRAVDPLANSPKARAAFERGLAAKRSEMAQTRVPTDRTRKAMYNLAVMGMIGA